MFLRLCLNSRIVLVYLLMVVTEEAMQAVKELQAKLEEKRQEKLSYNEALNNQASLMDLRDPKNMHLRTNNTQVVANNL